MQYCHSETASRQNLFLIPTGDSTSGKHAGRRVVDVPDRTRTPRLYWNKPFGLQATNEFRQFREATRQPDFELHRNFDSWSINSRLIPDGKRIPQRRKRAE